MYGMLVIRSTWLLFVPYKKIGDLQNTIYCELFEMVVKVPSRLRIEGKDRP
jgi:hypothetical protein